MLNYQEYVVLLPLYILLYIRMDIYQFIRLYTEYFGHGLKFIANYFPPAQQFFFFFTAVRNMLYIVMGLKLYRKI